MLEEINIFFTENNFDNVEVKIDNCTTIKNVKKFAETHINFLKNNPKNKAFLPYYERLVKCYKKLKK